MAAKKPDEATQIWQLKQTVADLRRELRAERGRAAQIEDTAAAIGKRMVRQHAQESLCLAALRSGRPTSPSPLAPEA